MSIEDELGKDLEDLLREAVRSESNEERLAYYPGKVVDNKDPIKKGRCRIRVFGIYGDSIGDDDLPWADNDSSFNGSEVGSFVVPPVGALVNVRFNGNDFNLPRYTSKVVASPDKMVSNPLGDYPDTMASASTIFAFASSKRREATNILICSTTILYLEYSCLPILHVPHTSLLEFLVPHTSHTHVESDPQCGHFSLCLVLS